MASKAMADMALKSSIEERLKAREREREDVRRDMLKRQKKIKPEPEYTPEQRRRGWQLDWQIKRMQPGTNRGLAGEEQLPEDAESLFEQISEAYRRLQKEKKVE